MLMVQKCIITSSLGMKTQGIENYSVSETIQKKKLEV